MSRLFLGMVMSTTLLLVLRAQDVPPAATALVEGSVFNKISGNAVKRAHVTCVRVGSSAGGEAPEEFADTDVSGHFTLHLEPGAYRLWVERPGFSHQNYKATSSSGTGDSLTLTAGQELRDVIFRIAPFGAIAGHVFDEDGEPVQGAGIQVLKFSYASGQRTLLPVSGASSNDRGEYRAFGLPPARYLLLATQRGGPLSPALQSGTPPPATLIADTQELYAPMFYPGVLEPSGAVQLPLTEGQEMQDINFRLARVRAVTLLGRLLSPAGNLADGQLQVLLAPRDGNAASRINRLTGVINRSNGHFEFHGVPPGSYFLVASQMSRGQTFSARYPVDVVNTIRQDEIALQLTPAAELLGDVQFEGGPPDALKGSAVTLTEAEGLVPGPRPAAPVAADGAVRLAGVSPGMWQVALSPMPKGAWIKSVSFGGHDLPSQAIEVAPGQGGTLRIVLAAKAGRISGTVVDAGSPHRGTVVLVPSATELRAFPFLFATSLAGEQGKFLLNDIRPGLYKIFAFDEIPPFAWLDPDFLKTVESSGLEIAVGEADQIDRQLTIIPTESPEAAR